MGVEQGQGDMGVTVLKGGESLEVLSLEADLPFPLPWFSPSQLRGEDHPWKALHPDGRGHSW